MLDLESRPELAPADVVWGRIDVPPADCAVGATQRRYKAVSPSNSSIVLLLAVVVDSILNLETIAFFLFEKLMTQVVRFWAKI